MICRIQSFEADPEILNSGVFLVNSKYRTHLKFLSIVQYQLFMLLFCMLILTSPVSFNQPSIVTLFCFVFSKNSHDFFKKQSDLHLECQIVWIQIRGHDQANRIGRDLDPNYLQSASTNDTKKKGINAILITFASFMKKHLHTENS